MKNEPASSPEKTKPAKQPKPSKPSKPTKKKIINKWKIKN